MIIGDLLLNKCYCTASVSATSKLQFLLVLVTAIVTASVISCATILAVFTSHHHTSWYIKINYLDRLFARINRTKNTRYHSSSHSC